MSNLEKINVLTKNKLDSLDLTQYPNQIFGTTDEVAEGGGSGDVVSNEAIAFAESERQKSKNLLDWTKYTIRYGDVTSDGNGQFSCNSTKYYNELSFYNINFEIGKTYTFSEYVKSFSDSENSGVQIEVNIEYVNGDSNTFYKSIYSDDIGKRVGVEFSIISAVLRINVRFLRKQNNTSTLTGTVNDLMICEGIDTDYQPYNGAIVHEKDVAGLRGTVLWTNPSPTQTFASQTITLSSSDYDYLEIYFYASKSNVRTKTVVYEKGEYGFLMDYCASGSSVGPRTFVRNANVTNNTSVFFENGYEGYNSGEYLQNDGVIPIKIIGYKRS